MTYRLSAQIYAGFVFCLIAIAYCATSCSMAMMHDDSDDKVGEIITKLRADLETRVYKVFLDNDTVPPNLADASTLTSTRRITLFKQALAQTVLSTDDLEDKGFSQELRLSLSESASTILTIESAEHKYNQIPNVLRLFEQLVRNMLYTHTRVFIRRTQRSPTIPADLDRHADDIKKIITHYSTLWPKK